MASAHGEPRTPLPNRPSRPAAAGASADVDLVLLREVLGGLAHDLNNQLSAIQGNLELAQMHELPTAAALRVMGAQNAVRTAVAVLRRVQGLTRSGSGVAEMVDVNALVEECVWTAKRAADSRLHVTVDTDPRTAHVSGRATLLDHAFRILIVQAGKNASEDGTVQVRTGNVTLGEADRALRPWVHPGNYVRVEIADSGPAMSNESTMRLFDPLSGGPGLSIVYAIVKRHHGYIHMDAARERGITYRIDLPCCG